MSQFTFSSQTSPAVSTREFSHIPEVLRNVDNWLVVHSSDKSPACAVLCQDFSPTCVSHLLTFEEAVGRLDSDKYLAFQFTDTKFWGLDVDNVAEDGELLPRFEGLIDQLTEMFPTYCEWSVSSTGLHLIGAGSLKDGFKHEAPLAEDAHLELYDDKRYFTMTGQRVDQSFAGVAHLEERLHEFQENTFPVSQSTESLSDDAHGEFGTTEVSATPATIRRTVEAYANADHPLTEMAKQTLDLWETTPTRGTGTKGDGYGSEKDLKMVSFTAFWCRDDSGLIERVWKQETRRWDDKAKRDDYRRGTINFALMKSGMGTFQSRWVK